MPRTGTHLEDLLRRARCARFHHTGGTAGEDDGARGRVAGERRFAFLEGDDFAIDAGFAHAARDQLRHLRAEIDNKNGGCHDGI
jgi:hypothetical protein